MDDKENISIAFNGFMYLNDENKRVVFLQEHSWHSYNKDRLRAEPTV